MHEIRVHNTLSGKVEPFVPLKPGEIRMYTCGPTVYDYAHIGNFRTFVFQDILRRFLHLRGFKLTHVMNLTDVDDRIIANAAAAGMSHSRLHGKIHSGVLRRLPHAQHRNRRSTGSAPRTTSTTWWR